MKLQIGSESNGLATAKAVGLLGLTLLVALISASCRSGPITANAYSESVGPNAMAADERECRKQGTAERMRLLTELVSGDSEVAKREGRESAGGAAGKTIVKMEGGSTAAGAVGGAVGEFIFSSWDSDTYDEDMLANYLGIDAGLGDGFRASRRLAYICLRKKGYQVVEFEEDGAGTAYLEREPRARVVLREEDGTEVVFYEYVP